MENLKLVSQTVYRDHTTPIAILRSSSGINQQSSFLIDSSSNLIEVDLSSNRLQRILQIYPSIDDGNVPLLFETILEDETIIAAYQNGDIFTLNPIEGSCELCGSIEGGIKDASMSPDEDLIAFITSKDTFVLMTRSLEPIIEKVISSIEFGENEFINVGWGSKETQFHGTIGKTAAKEKLPNQYSSHPKDSDEGSKTSVLSWRNDGSLFATSTWDEQANLRKVRVWDREGKLQATSEGIHCLDTVLTWDPSGALIASAQAYPAQDRQDIIFFERNGLRHGEFKLIHKLSEYEINNLNWSSESKYLFITGHLKKENRQLLSVYTRQNYHWYLKQHFFYQPSEFITHIRFNPTDSLQMHSTHKDGSYRTVKWTRLYDQHNTTVTSIDGQKLHITPYDKTSVPPPMSHHNIELPSSIIFIAFGHASESIVALCADGSIHEILYDKRTNSHKMRPLGSIICAGNQFLHLFVLSNGICLFARTEENDKLMKMEEKTTGELSITRNGALSHVDYGRSCLFASRGDVLLSYTETKKVLLINSCDLSILRTISTTHTCLAIQLMKIHNENVTVFHTKNQRITVGDHDVGLAGVTSFHIHSRDYLLCTTGEQRLYIISFNEILNGKANKIIDSSEQSDFILQRNWRSIETGAVIVSSDSESGKVILQMPRGNLEIIYPRQLLIPLVSNLIDRKSYKEALLIMRKHRINLNFLIDYDPQQFQLCLVDNVLSSFSSNDICLLLGELSNQLTTLPKGIDTLSETGNKTDRVCTLIRLAIMKKSEWQNNYLDAVLMTFIKRSNRDVESALKIVKDLPGNRDKTEPLKFLAHLLDTETLFRAALGSYDTDLVLMVARITQKDPKEYLPFLNEVESITDLFLRNYKIDMFLGKHESALMNLSKCSEDDDNNFSSCIQLIQEYRLYSTGTKLWPINSENSRKVWSLYGDYLKGKQHYSEAATCYSRANLLNQSIVCCQLVNDWKGALKYASQAKYTDAQLSSLAGSLATNLENNGSHIDAAYLCERYVTGDGQLRALRILMNGGEWDRVLMLLASLSESHPQVQQEVLTSLMTKGAAFLENSSTQMKKLEELMWSVNNGRKLRRETKDSQTLALDAGGDLPDDDMSTVNSVSDRSSASRLTGSIATKKTAKTDKVAKKKAMKKYILKKGTPNEDLAAIYEIKTSFLPLIEEMQCEAKQLIHAIYEIDFQQDLSVKIQKEFGQLIGVFKQSLHSIWLPLDCRNPTEDLIPDDELRSRPAFKSIEWKLAVLPE